MSNVDNLNDYSILAKKQSDLLYAPIGSGGSSTEINNGDDITLSAETEAVVLTNTSGSGDSLVLN